jgi:hypothetical protein
MYNDISTFLREMPLKHYLAGGFWSTREPTLAFFIGREQVQALAAGGRGGVGYESSLEKDSDAPPFAGGQSNPSPGAKSSRTLSRKLTSRYRLRRNVKHLFIVDADKKDQFFSVDTLERLRQKSVTSALEEMHENPQQVFGNWDESTPFRWAIVDKELRLGHEPGPRLDEPILMFGLADEVCAGDRHLAAPGRRPGLGQSHLGDKRSGLSGRYLDRTRRGRRSLPAPKPGLYLPGRNRVGRLLGP